MSTATEGIKEQETKIRRHAFEAHMKDFIETYAPKGGRDRVEFEMCLISLVQQIYSDAQAPLIDSYTKLAMSIPFSMLREPK